jgi:hypothetical protein
MKRSTLLRTTAACATCAIAGAAAGIAGSSASTPAVTKGPLRGAWLKLGPDAPPLPLDGAGPPLPFDGAAGPAVHSEAVVPNDKGGFDTVTMDHGRFASLSGQKLTITEGTATATYKTVTLTIPADAKVLRNGEAAGLSDLKAGDTVDVVAGARGTIVAAFDAQHEPKLELKLRAGRGPGLDQQGSAPGKPGAMPAPPAPEAPGS